jgi:hypothetical protein
MTNKLCSTMATPSYQETRLQNFRHRDLRSILNSLLHTIIYFHLVVELFLASGIIICFPTSRWSWYSDTSKVLCSGIEMLSIQEYGLWFEKDCFKTNLPIEFQGQSSTKHCQTWLWMSQAKSCWKEASRCCIFSFTLQITSVIVVVRSNRF